MTAKLLHTLVLAGLFVFPTQSSACSLSLILAIDVSSSVDSEEYRLQVDGTASALEDPEVIAAIEEVGGIQIMAFEWSGAYRHFDMVSWTSVDDAADIFAVSSGLRAHARVRNDLPTSMGSALGYAATRFTKAPMQCARNVIDVSGDGVNNEGFGPIEAYENFPFAGIQVNGLVITGADPDPEPFYRNEVRFGVGSFIEVALGFENFQDAMKRKLLREIRGAALSMAH
ncbi:MAG: DUF1194 domain-containing protein [Pseudomonadota bacterium]